MIFKTFSTPSKFEIEKLNLSQSLKESPRTLKDAKFPVIDPDGLNLRRATSVVEELKQPMSVQCLVPDNSGTNSTAQTLEYSQPQDCSQCEISSPLLHYQTRASSRNRDPEQDGHIDTITFYSLLECITKYCQLQLVCPQRLAIWDKSYQR